MVSQGTSAVTFCCRGEAGDVSEGNLVVDIVKGNFGKLLSKLVEELFSACSSTVTGRTIAFSSSDVFLISAIALCKASV